MNPFKFSEDDSSPFENQPKAQWLPRQQRKWKWPADYRSFVCWVFALMIPTSLWRIFYAILHPRSRMLLQNLLVGPMFYSVVATMSGIALWTLWKDKPWAKHWAVATSSVYFLIFLRQFIIPVRPAWDHYLSELIISVAGVLAFWWTDKQVNTPNSGSA